MVSNSVFLFQRINPNDPYCSIYDEITSATKNTILKGSEPVTVDYVAVDVKNKKQLQKVSRSFHCCCCRIIIIMYTRRIITVIKIFPFFKLDMP